MRMAIGDFQQPRARAVAMRVTLALLMVVQPLRAQDQSEADLDASIARGLAFLARLQKEDGTFEGGGPRLAMTALALMAFLSAGHAPDSGKHGLTVRRCIDALIRAAPEDGYFGRIDGSRMYGQGIITLALAEVYGVETNTESREKIEKVFASAVRVILKAQEVKKGPPHAGGWRYEPSSGDSDLSLSGWNALALRAAQNVGMTVAKEPVERAVSYVLQCFRKDKSGFSYQPGHDPTVAMTGVGVLSLYLLDAAGQPELQAAAKYLVEHPIQNDTRFFYYSLYYTAQAAFQCGEPTWPAVWKVTRERLVGIQMEDGGWPQSRTGEEPGRIYATSMAILALTVTYRLLPIYQR